MNNQNDKFSIYFSHLKSKEQKPISFLIKPYSNLELNDWKQKHEGYKFIECEDKIIGYYYDEDYYKIGEQNGN